MSADTCPTCPHGLGFRCTACWTVTGRRHSVPPTQELPVVLEIVYALMHNPCVYESAAGLLSLHATRKGAWRAKIAHAWKREVDHREDYLRGYAPRSRRRESLFPEWEAYSVERYEVNE